MKKLSLLLSSLWIPSMASAQDDGYGHMNMDGGWHMMNGGYAGLFMWILLIVGIILIVFLVMQFSKDKGGGATPHESALDILKNGMCEAKSPKRNLNA